MKHGPQKSGKASWIREAGKRGMEEKLKKEYFLDKTRCLKCQENWPLRYSIERIWREETRKHLFLGFEWNGKVKLSFQNGFRLKNNSGFYTSALTPCISPPAPSLRLKTGVTSPLHDFCYFKWLPIPRKESINLSTLQQIQIKSGLKPKKNLIMKIIPPITLTPLIEIADDCPIEQRRNSKTKRWQKTVLQKMQ